MPVSTGSLGEPRAKRCKHCDESSHRSESGSGYWQLQLDRDLVETISAIYPDWFKSSMAEGVPPAMAPARDSPPKAVVDTSPLLNSLEQNKESLKVKLMLRRPVEQLRAQGIMPPLKTPAAFHGQRRQLERAKTGDLLKTKIQQRPSRLELESRHILEADPHVDPSLAEKQRMLKKARLADQLNDQLSHRPGPLELIQKNILHTEEPIEHAVKAGHIPYRATCEGQFNRPQHPLSYVTPEEDSQSSEDNVTASPLSVDMLETAAKSAGIVVSLLPASEGAVVVTTSSSVLNKDNSEIFADLCRSVAAPLLNQASSPASLSLSSTSTLSPLSSIASPAPSQPPTPAPVTLTPRPIPSPVRTDAPGKDKNRKKSKSKAIPKTRTIKFHEYKGPPSAQKSSSPNNPSPGESSYDLLLQQQTLLLQFQLQLQHKYPQIILPAQKNIENSNPTNPVPSPAPSDSSLSTRLIGRLEDMKVSDLKAELKRRNLPVSGSKPQLIERLKTNMTNGDCSIASGGDDSSHNSPQHTDVGSPGLAEDQEHMEMDPQSPQILQCDLKTQEELVRDQQRKIEELQRELTLSQMKLQAATRAEPKAQCLALKKHLQAKQQQQPMVIQMQQMLQSEEQAKIQQQQHVAFQNQKNLNGNLVLNRNDAALVLNHLVQGRNKLKNNTRANSLPNFINSIVVEAAEEKPPPPIYEEAIKKEKSIKSQTVDDVLEILIKNGELPPSAAQDPLTPNSVKAEPPYPINETPESALGLDAADLLNTLDTLETMDFTQLIELGAQPQTNNNSTVPMDTDDWLESLLPPEINVNNNHQDLGYDPLMGIAPDPFDPFCLEDFRSPTELSWGDKVDFAA